MTYFQISNEQFILIQKAFPTKNWIKQYTGACCMMCDIRYQDDDNRWHGEIHGIKSTDSTLSGCLENLKLQINAKIAKMEDELGGWKEIVGK